MHNISETHDCYGCGVCAIVCPTKIIDIRYNKNGFYEPSITDSSKCVKCGLCLDICAYHHDKHACHDTFFPIKSFAAWSKNNNVRLECSSGGVGFEIGLFAINNNYKVCGVKYNPQHSRAEHYIATTKSELTESIGSKYLQSYTISGLNKINWQERHLIIGTPCQIDSLRRFIRKKKVENNFILVDFFCHSVPSIWIWKYYLSIAEKKIGKITSASWRNKNTGWHDSWSMNLKSEDGIITSRKSEGDLFYKLYLGDFYCNPACRIHCKYKYNSSSADIRIGDLWGKTYSNDSDGVSALIAFSPKGSNIIAHLNNCALNEIPFETAAEGQMKRNIGRATFSSMMQLCLKHKTPMAFINILIIAEKVVNKIKSRLV